MTVHYSQKVANQRSLGTFVTLLFRWHGSVYKSVWRDMIVYLVLYFLISFTYRFALTDFQKGIFEDIVQSCSDFRKLIPMQFMLGFFVSIIVGRWWGTYISFPWPDTTAILLATHIQGHDIVAQEIRSTILRYVNLTIAITFSLVSPTIQKKLNSWEEFVKEGYLTEAEMKIIKDMERRVEANKTWLPIMWATKIAEKAKQDGYILNDIVMNTVITEINNVRRNCGKILGWNDQNIPLVYTQLVTIAAYCYFCTSIIGEQYLDPAKNIEGHSIDLYVPMFAFLQLFFYTGWFKVAEALLNPFGEDDHDFEFLPLLKRHLEICKMLGEPEQADMPPAVNDIARIALHSSRAESYYNQTLSLALPTVTLSDNKSVTYIDSYG